MKLPPVVSSDEWQAARESLLVKEKEATRARDALAAERRTLPLAQIDKDYLFDGPDGTATLPDLFDGRPQLILYHFMFAPGVDGWPSAGCPGCSMFVDQIGHSPGPFPRTGHVLCAGVTGAAGRHRVVQGADGLDGAVVLLLGE